MKRLGKKRRRRTAVEKLRETINEMAWLHKLRFEGFRRAEKDFTKKLREQSVVHAQEVVAGFDRRQELQAALRVAISLVRASRQNEWTPACDQEFASVQEAAK